MLDEVLCLEVSNLARQLKFQTEIADDNPVVSHLTASLWSRSTYLTILSSTSGSKRLINERNNVAGAEKQLESMKNHLT